eukprot:COSAG02_NODE_92_length_37588_cov_135.916242_1_plen_87_part_10
MQNTVRILVFQQTPYLCTYGRNCSEKPTTSVRKTRFFTLTHALLLNHPQAPDPIYQKTRAEKKMMKVLAVCGLFALTKAQDAAADMA